MPCTRSGEPMPGLLPLLWVLLAGPDLHDPDPGPAPTSWQYASFVVDTKRDRIVKFGGRGERGFENDVWTLSLSDSSARWERLATEGAEPSPRMRHGAAYDARNDRMLVFGGHWYWEGRPDIHKEFDDLWSLSLSDHRWERLAPEGDGPGLCPSAALLPDAEEPRCLLVGGWGRVWSLDLGPVMRWTLLECEGHGPGDRYGMASVFDPAGGGVFSFGGYKVRHFSLTPELDVDFEHGDVGRMFHDVLRLDLRSPPRWSRLPTRESQSPPVTCDAAMALDSKRGQLVIDVGSQGRRLLGELWVMRLDDKPRWRRVRSVSLPRPSAGMRILIDQKRDELLLLGGSDPLSMPYRIPLSALDFARTPTDATPSR
jgi:hypothetical protein